MRALALRFMLAVALWGSSDRLFSSEGTPECTSHDGRRFMAIQLDETAPKRPFVLALFGPAGREVYPRFEIASSQNYADKCSFARDAACEFSPDGKRLIHLARNPANGSCFVVLDGEVVGPGAWFKAPRLHAGSLFKPAVFSPDSTRVAYAVKSADGWRVVVDGREEGPFQGLRDGWDERGRKRQLFFSPDGRRLAYGAKTSGRWVAVVDGSPGNPYDEVGRPVFSPDSRRVGHRARRGKQWLVVADGLPGKAYDDIEQASLIDRRLPRDEIAFSRDSRRLTYRARLKAKAMAVVDSREGPEYDQIGSISISPDSQHVAYAAKREGRWRLVIDNVEHGEHDFCTDAIPGLGVLSQSGEDRGVVFDDARHLHILVRRGGECVLLGVELP